MTNPQFNMLDHITELEVLYLAQAGAESPLESVRDLSSKVMTYHIVSEFKKEGKLEFTPEEVAAKMQQLVFDFTTQTGVELGHLEATIDPETGETMYSITAAGQEIINSVYSEEDE